MGCSCTAKLNQGDILKYIVDYVFLSQEWGGCTKCTEIEKSVMQADQVTLALGCKVKQHITAQIFA